MLAARPFSENTRGHSETSEKRLIENNSFHAFSRFRKSAKPWESKAERVSERQKSCGLCFYSIKTRILLAQKTDFSTNVLWEWTEKGSILARFPSSKHGDRSASPSTTCRLSPCCRVAPWRWQSKSATVRVIGDTPVLYPGDGVPSHHSLLIRLHGNPCLGR